MSWRTRNEYLLESRARGVLRTAHGGASWEASPNTRAAVEKAVQATPDYIELDVHLTIDDALVLWHDPVVITPGGAHVIAQTTLGALRALTLPDGEFITLEEALALMRGQCGVMIDLKAPGLEDAIEKLLTRLDFREVIVCGGYFDTLKNLKVRMPDLAVSLTPDEAQYSRLSEVTGAAPFLDAVTVYWRTVSPAMLDELHGQGVIVLAWTVDYANVAGYLSALGVDGLTTNNMALIDAHR